VKIALDSDAYAEWHPGARTINYYRFTMYEGDTHGFAAGRWVNYGSSSFGYHKPDNSTTQIEMLDVLIRYIETVYRVDGEA
jgi:hypothetical protein